jgi:hypothetical protein
MAAEAAYDRICPLRLKSIWTLNDGLRALGSLALLLHCDRVLKRAFQYIELFVV